MGDDVINRAAMEAQADAFRAQGQSTAMNDLQSDRSQTTPLSFFVNPPTITEEKERKNSMKMTLRAIMKSSGIPALPVVAVAVVLAATSSAYAAGYKLADKVGASIADFRDEVVEVKAAVDATLTSLDKVVADAAVDPRKAFKAFDSNVSKIDSAANRAKKRSEEMKGRGQKYFDAWKVELASVNDADVRKLAEERKAKLETSFGTIRTKMEPARDQFNAWLSNLKDVQRYLSQDLTVAGIDAAKDLIAKTKTQGAEVQATLDSVISELNTVVATIMPAKVKK
jgi:ribosome-associated translation inhibitor RaiA